MQRYYLKRAITADGLLKVFTKALGPISHRWDCGTGRDEGFRLFYVNGELATKLDPGDIWMSLLLDDKGAKVFRKAGLLDE